MRIPKGFTSNVRDARILSLCVHGQHRSGRTRLISTAPGPIGILPLDRNTRATIAKMQKAFPKKQFFISEQDLLRVEGMEEIDVNQRAWSGDESLLTPAEIKKRAEATHREIRLYRDHQKRIMELYHALLSNPDIRSIGIDTGTQLAEDFLSAHYGRTYRINPFDRAAYNADMSDVWNLAASAGKHLVVTHLQSEVWGEVIEGGKKKRAPIEGKYKLKGWNDSPYRANILVQTWKCQSRSELQALARELEVDWQDLNNPTFAARIYDSQANPLLVAEGGSASILIDEMVDFRMIGTLVYPDTNLEDWE